MAKQPRTDTDSVLKLVIDGKQAQTSLRQLADTAARYRGEFSKMTRESDPKKYDELAGKLRKLDGVIKETRNSIRSATDESKSFKNSLADLAKQAAAGVTVAGVFYGVTNGIKTAIHKNAELSDSYADVMKTTGLTEESVDRLNDKFKRMDTRTANAQLLELASVAGKLGYSSERDVEGFVRAADKIGVALGEDLGGVEEAVNSLGKLVNIFKVTDDFELEDALLKIGSAINTLGAEGTAAEKNLIDFAQRMAGIAPAANISLPTVLAYGAVMDELGQSMESSSTAIGQFIVGMGSDIPKYAKIAKMSVKEFSDLLLKDANEAFLRVLENSKTAGGGIQALATNMGILEVSGARGIQALGAMADNIDLVRKRMDTATDSFNDGSSVIDEFNTKNTNLAANLEKIWNRIDNLWQNSSFRNWMTEITGALVDNRSEFERLNDEYNRAQGELENLEKELNPAIARYEELTTKTNLNATETEELRRLIIRLSEQWPIAVSEVDSYGNALAINTGILQQNIEEHNNYLRHINKVAIEEGNLEKQRKQRYANQLKRELTEKKTKEFQGSAGTGGGGGQYIERALSNSELKAKRTELESINNEISAIDYSLRRMGDVPIKKISTKPLVDFKDESLSTIEGLNTKIKELRSNLSKEGLSMEEFKQTDAAIKTLTTRLRELNEAEDAKNAGKGGKGGGKPNEDKKAEREAEQQKRREEQAKEHFARLLKEEELFSLQQEINKKAKNEKEEELLKLDYQKKIDKFKEFAAKEEASVEDKASAIQQIKKLETDRDNAVKELGISQEREYIDSLAKIREELNRKKETELQKEQNLINAHYDKLAEEASQDSNVQKRIEEDRQRDLADAKIRENERFHKEVEQLNQVQDMKEATDLQKKHMEIDLQYRSELAKLEEKYSEDLQLTEEFLKAKEELENFYNNKKQEATEEFEQDKWQRVKDIAVGFAQSIADATFSIISNNIQAESNARLSALQDQRDNELSSKNLTEKRKKEINDKYDKLERAEKLRAWNAQKRADILSATINTALAVTRAIPNWILAAAAGVAGAAQIAVIASQKPPQFAKGGLLPNGSSHAQGGINLIDSRTNQAVGNIEGGEPILSRSTYANNREVVDALLYSSQRKNGARIQVSPLAMEAERAVRYGGYSPVASSAPVINNNVDVPATDNSEMLELLRVIANKESKVVFSNRLYEDHKAQNMRIEDRANA